MLGNSNVDKIATSQVLGSEGKENWCAQKVLGKLNNKIIILLNNKPLTHNVRVMIWKSTCWKQMNGYHPQFWWQIGAAESVYPEKKIKCALAVSSVCFNFRRSFGLAERTCVLLLALLDALSALLSVVPSLFCCCFILNANGF